MPNDFQDRKPGSMGLGSTPGPGNLENKKTSTPVGSGSDGFDSVEMGAWSIKSVPDGVLKKRG